MKELIPILLFALSTTLTPGPNNFMIMYSGMHFGVKQSLPHYLGICLGFPAMVLLVSLGLGEVFTHCSWIKQILKILGSLYMLYLAWQILTSNSKANPATVRRPWKFWQTCLFQWVNPKAWLMAISTTSIFTLSNSYFINAVAISTIYFLMCIPCIGAWLLFGTVLQRILKKDSHRLWFNIVMAVSLVASIGMILLD